LEKGLFTGSSKLFSNKFLAPDLEKVAHSVFSALLRKFLGQGEQNLQFDTLYGIIFRLNSIMTEVTQLFFSTT